MAKSKTKAPPSQDADGRRTPCTGTQHGKRTVSLPVVAGEKPKPPPLRASGAGKWRALSLIAVHVLIVAHYLHWKVAGNTLTPVEPSESMETLREGAINAGFVFFSAAILLTLVLGRFVCGWACHLIAVQDLTTWVLKKLHLRPKAFRSRLLLVVPMLAAIYMFILPLVDRLYVQHMQGGHVTPFHLALTRTGFWDTFPGLTVAILTFVFAAMVNVYLLGPKAFCTYACPYGAFFGLADKVAAGRIRVTDACEGCGHCTATCTSNVNVADEVRTFGMVVDPGCMKCLDCVSVCPNDALYFGFGKLPLTVTPSEVPKPRKWDLTWPEEGLAAIAFLVFFLADRGIYGGSIPFLFALGLAGIGMFVTMKFYRLCTARDAAVQKIRLKNGGRVTGLGGLFAAAYIGLAALTVHSGLWQWHRFQAGRAFNDCPGDRFAWQFEPHFFDSVTPFQKARAIEGLAHVDWCLRWGLLDAVDLRTEAAWMALVAGRSDEAVRQLTRVCQVLPEQPGYRMHLGIIETYRGQDVAAEAAFREAVRVSASQREALEAKGVRRPDATAARIWTEWASFLSRRNRTAEAEEAFEHATRLDPTFGPAWLARGEFQLRAGRIDDARRSLIEAVVYNHGDLTALMGLHTCGRTDGQNFSAAVGEYRAAIERRSDLVVLHDGLGYALTQVQRFGEAVTAFRAAVQLRPDSPDAHADLGAAMLMVGDATGAIQEYENVNRLLPGNAEAMLKLGILYEEVGRGADALRQYQQAAKLGDGPLRAAAQAGINRLTSPPSAKP